ncbi:MAG: hypothetical protein QOG03_9 [Actinomycetota bacterium]|jgi:hypothetical protein|nr:hypothetical protein [Actinomycetota bacterium]
METTLPDLPPAPVAPRRSYRTETVARFTAVLGAIGMAFLALGTVITVSTHGPLMAFGLAWGASAGLIFVCLAVLAGERWAPGALVLCSTASIVVSGLVHRPGSAVINVVILIILVGDRGHWAEIAAAPTRPSRWFPLSLEAKVAGLLLIGVVVGIVCHRASQPHPRLRVVSGVATTNASGSNLDLRDAHGRVLFLGGLVPESIGSSGVVGERAGSRAPTCLPADARARTPVRIAYLAGGSFHVAASAVGQLVVRVECTGPSTYP